MHAYEWCACYSVKRQKFVCNKTDQFLMHDLPWRWPTRQLRLGEKFEPPLVQVSSSNFWTSSSSPTSVILSQYTAGGLKATAFCRDVGICACLTRLWVLKTKTRKASKEQIFLPKGAWLTDVYIPYSKLLYKALNI